ncbi:hypothetical protein BN891_15990 [Bacteroides xylanisolvens SD CC 2a]|nr:hypothetical protein BN891_15990 [Bacteroides xylanisolvens SD CC 2a]
METSSYEIEFFTKVKDWKQKRCNIYYTFRKKKYSLYKKQPIYRPVANRYSSSFI